MPAHAHAGPVMLPGAPANITILPAAKPTIPAHQYPLPEANTKRLAIEAKLWSTV